MRVNSLTSFMRSVNLGGSSMSNRTKTTEERDKSDQSAMRMGGVDQQAPSQAWLQPDLSSTEWLVTGQNHERSDGQTLPLRSIQVDHSMKVVRDHQNHPREPM